MQKQIFVNLAVGDLNKSIDFFTKMGFKFNPQFTNENATCMIIGENIFVMLLVESFFKSFIKKELADPKKTTEVLIALNSESKEKVDELLEKATHAGALSVSSPTDHGFMYTRNFEDLDGHIWEIFWMDPNYLQKNE